MLCQQRCYVSYTKMLCFFVSSNLELSLCVMYNKDVGMLGATKMLCQVQQRCYVRCNKDVMLGATKMLC